MGQPRIFFSMSRDRLLPEGVSKVHPRFGTPYITTIITGVIVAAVAALTPINVVGEMTSIGTLFAFVLVCIGIMVMRRTHPELHRPFKTPLVPAVPILGILFNLTMMYGLGWENWTRLFVWMVIGLVIYFSYSRKRSHVGRLL
jgi:APA family basic amino acid/polyamine antiporter